MPFAKAEVWIGAKHRGLALSRLREQQAEAAKFDAAIEANLKELGFWETT
jgi:hypothetical protein